MSLVTQKIELIHTIEQQFLGNVDFLNKLIFGAVDEKLLDFEIKKGLFVNNENAALTVQEIKKEIMAIIQGDKYTNRFKEWLKNYEQLTTNNIRIQKSVNGLKLKSADFKDIKKASVDKVIEDLVGIGVEANFVAPLSQALMRNVILGSSVSDTKSYLQNYIFGDGETDGKMTRYAGQLARDSVSQFDGQVNQQIMNTYEMDAFAYVGSLVDDSRPFCIYIMNELDGMIPVKELPALLKRAMNSETFGRGMIEGTTPENFAVYRGGYNCRHAAIPVFDDNKDKL